MLSRKQQKKDCQVPDYYADKDKYKPDATFRHFVLEVK
jgi:hypothetical protein